jgi:hypothetical protein
MDKSAFEAEGDRLVREAGNERLVLRLLGALAFAKRCPAHAFLQERLGRAYTDVDFAAYGKQADAIRAFLARQGYVDNPEVYIASEGSRVVAEHPRTGLHLDVFLDKLEFCHTVPWHGRLELHDETIPLAEMLLQKMQIVRINEKDLIDTIMLLLEHPLTEDDVGVNMRLVAELCARDWGWWRTLTMNLVKVKQMAEHYDELTPDETGRVGTQVEAALARIEDEPKSMGWRLRAKVGDRKKWYRDVDEVAPVVERG